ncbi:hypothetical protein HK096_008333, partial [Nowakowskiella sp. JEL0078]
MNSDQLTLGSLNEPFESHRQQIPSPPSSPNIYLAHQNSLSQETKSAIARALCNSHFERNYKLVEVIGWGSNGVVLCAEKRHCQRKSLVAVKLIYKSQRIISEKSKLPREILAFQRYSPFQATDSCLLKFIDYFDDDGIHCLVTDLFGTNWTKIFNASWKESSESITLITETSAMRTIPVNNNDTDLCTFMSFFHSPFSLDEASRNKMPNGLIKSILRQSALAVKELHENGIVHGDLKEENILIQKCETGIQVKLCDYGHCRICSCNFSPSEVIRGCKKCGTLLFKYGTEQMTPPEIVENLILETKNRSSGFQMDIWALGIIFLTLLKGIFPKTCDRISEYL